MDCDQRMTCRDCLAEDNKCFWVNSNVSIDSFCTEDFSRAGNNSIWLQPGNYVECFASQSIQGDRRREVSAEEIRLGYVVLGLCSLLLVFIVICILTCMKSERQNTTTPPTPLNSVPVVCEVCNRSFNDGRMKSWVKTAEPQPDDSITTIEVPEDLVRVRALDFLPKNGKYLVCSRECRHSNSNP